MRAGLANRAWDYPWSSAKAHVLGFPDELLKNEPDLKMSGLEWQAYLEEVEGQNGLEALRGASRTGVPLGSDEFKAGIARALGRPVQPGARGRPRKGGVHK